MFNHHQTYIFLFLFHSRIIQTYKHTDIHTNTLTQTRTLPHNTHTHEHMNTADAFAVAVAAAVDATADAADAAGYGFCFASFCFAGFCSPVLVRRVFDRFFLLAGGGAPFFPPAPFRWALKTQVWNRAETLIPYNCVYSLSSDQPKYVAPGILLKIRASRPTK